MILSSFPKKIFEDVYLTKVVVRRRPNDAGSKSVEYHVLLIPSLMVKEQAMIEGAYICKIKRLSDGYCEEEVMLAIQEEGSNTSYPMVAELPGNTGFGDAESVYIRVKRIDMEKWFKSKKSKGFER